MNKIGYLNGGLEEEIYNTLGGGGGKGARCDG